MGLSIGENVLKSVVYILKQILAAIAPNLLEGSPSEPKFDEFKIILSGVDGSIREMFVYFDILEDYLVLLINND